MSFDPDRDSFPNTVPDPRKQVPLTVIDALRQGTQLLEQARIAVPRLTAEVLLAHAIGCERVWLFAHSTDRLKEVWWIHYGRYLHERLQGKPTQHITGTQEFYGRPFHVTPHVLIPRPETEHLVEAALEKTRELTAPGEVGTTEPKLKVADIGTGSGAIAITLSLELNAPVLATDLSLPALRVAARNAQALNAPVQFLATDLCASLPNHHFDLVVSNPPYVPSLDRATIQTEVRDHEPDLALYGGTDGLDVYRRLIPEAHRILKPGGWLLMEIGYPLRDAVYAMLEAPGPTGAQPWEAIETRSDLAGFPRVVLARRR